ncbi:MFS transporter [Corynebacterium sp. CCUG 71335]|nr:MFS transporter [Corynebacterium pseudogenitalium]MCQ4621743.1 MFS transporter [Corynebacterium sp. CCUG 71335]MCQ4625973.1 MFS transporter [Corynebacterium sp. CCUG 69979]MCQ4626262.1 MFS transporter [Corynebacterium sp. CCUG 65737]
MQKMTTKLSIFVLATALFVVTTSEFQVSAMMTDMAVDLGQPIGKLTHLVTAYSLGMALGGPTLAWALNGKPVRACLTGAVFVYAGVEITASFSPTFTVLLIIRFLTGCLSGAIFGLSLTAGVLLAGTRNQSRAAAAILSGLMAGTLLGLPLSHVIGWLAGWRMSFILLGFAAFMIAVVLAAALPRIPALSGEGTERVSVVSNPGVWSRMLTSFFTIGGSFAAFALIDPILRRAGFTPIGTTVALIGFGVAAFTGNLLWGKVSETNAQKFLLAGLSAQAVALLLLVATPNAGPITALAIVALGGTGMALNPLLVTRLMAQADPHPFINTVHTGFITMGAAAATAASGYVLANETSLTPSIHVGVVFTLIAWIITVVTPDHSDVRQG